MGKTTLVKTINLDALRAQITGDILFGWRANQQFKVSVCNKSLSNVYFNATIRDNVTLFLS